ncbi:MAG: hypothetical protein COT18_11795 [Elusimicrobia bacterium CG08_land_8_20_14_0_20_59_10]|nr:MAG: hypothetical protein COT18_11795 [Elusimicrobia bacterium CG08_land_8_20_14_0_20_59_10]
MKNLKDILFPAGKRHWKGSRAARIALRTAHLLGVSLLFGGHWFGLPKAELAPWLYLAAVSGAGLIALELYSGFDWLLQLAGGLVLLKLAVLLFIPAFWEERVALLVLAMVIGSAGSHMPGTLRHFYYIPPPGRRE